MRNEDRIRKYRKDPFKFVFEVFGFKLKRHQIQMIANLNISMKHNWARRTGKNYAIYACSIWRSFFYSNTKILIVCDFQRNISLMANELRQLISTTKLNDLGVDSGSFDHNTLRLSNGSEISFNTKAIDYQKYDYVFYNYNVQIPEQRECRLSSNRGPRIHLFDVESSFGDDLPSETVNVFEAGLIPPHGLVELYNNLGYNNFLSSFKCSPHDITELLRK